MMVMGVEAPWDISFEQLCSNKDEVLEGTGSDPVETQIRWLLDTQQPLDKPDWPYPVIERAVGEWDRILRSVVILARAYPEIPLERILDTAVIWERG